MGVLLTAVIALAIAAAVFHASGRRVVGGWLLVLSTASICIAALVDISRGVQQLGQGAIDSDYEQFAFSLALLGWDLFAALLPKWPWLFWTAWAGSAFVCSALIYLALFWKVFS